MEDPKVYEILTQIHKQLTMIATHLATLAQVARAQHPEAFTQLDPARVKRPPNRS
jgi:hypothetical protein